MRKMLACFLALLMCCTGLTAFAESLTLPEVLPNNIPANDKEINLIQMMTDFAAVVRQAGTDYSPSLIANYVYDLVKEFNQFYHDYSILHEENESVRLFRIVLSANIAKIVKTGMALLGIEVPERM